MNKQELIEYCESLKGGLNKFINGIDVDKIIAKIKQLDKPEKPVVPQFVADWIEYCKRHNFTLFGCLDPENGFESLVNESFEGDVRKCIRWCRRESNIFARAWLDGYTVEKEKRYTVKIKAVNQYLVKNPDEEFLGFLQSRLKSKFTRKELEDAGFGWVFDCEGIEIEEVQE